MLSWRSLLVVAVCTSLAGCGFEAPGTLVLINELDQARPEEPVVIARAELEARLGAIAPGLVPVAFMDDGAAIPGQVDDLDGDGRWDDWALLLSFTSKEVLRVRVDLLDSTVMPRFTRRTNVRVEEKSQGIMHPPKSQAVAWENDLVGFYLALDRPSGKQMLGKITKEMVFDSVSAAGESREKSLWGMNILNASSTLGAGALGLWTDGRLSRPDTGARTYCDLLSEGPARSVFQVRYSGWGQGDEAHDVLERITIWAGRPGFESAVTISGPESEHEFAAGIARSRDNSLLQWDWGTAYRALAVHGHFDAGEDAVGLAVLYPFDHAVAIGETAASFPGSADTVTDSYFVRLRMADGMPSTYHLYAVWEQQDYRWAEQASFENLLKNEAHRLASPIRLR